MLRARGYELIDRYEICITQKTMDLFCFTKIFSFLNHSKTLIKLTMTMFVFDLCLVPNIVCVSVLSIPDFRLCFFQHFSFSSSFGCLCKVFQTRCPTFTICIHVYDVLKLFKRFIVVLDCQMIYF